MVTPLTTSSSWRPLGAGILVGLTIAFVAGLEGQAVPRLTITSVIDGMSVSGVTPLAVRADAAGLSSVQFLVSGQPVGPAITAGSCLVSWDTRGWPNGSQTVTAVARTTTGGTVSATPVTVRVANGVPPDVTPPSVVLSSPNSGSVLAGTVALQATVSDASGVAGVWFTADGQTIGSEVAPTLGQASFGWPTTSVANGAHVLRAVARDAAGNVAASAGTTITLRNAAVGGDFDNDRDPDLLFQHTDGRLYLWLMEDGIAASQRGLTPPSIDPSWRVVGLDDFNGDGHSDVLVQNQTTGQTTLWYMNGSTRSGEVSVQAGSTPWRVSATADLDGDADPDIVWRLPATGQLYAWTTQNGVVNGGGALSPSTIDATWRIAGAFDVNRDGKSDLVWQNTSTGLIYIWYMNGFVMSQGGGTTPAAVPPVWRLDAVADFNRNGHVDFVWQHQTSGQLYLWNLAGNALVNERFLSPAQVDLAWKVVGGR